MSGPDCFGRWMGKGELRAVRKNGVYAGNELGYVAKERLDVIAVEPTFVEVRV